MQYSTVLVGDLFFGQREKIKMRRVYCDLLQVSCGIPIQNVTYERQFRLFSTSLEIENTEVDAVISRKQRVLCDATANSTSTAWPRAVLVKRFVLAVAINQLIDCQRIANTFRACRNSWRCKCGNFSGTHFLIRACKILSCKIFHT